MGEYFMNLLLKRDQTTYSGFSLIPFRIGKGVMFSLSAEIELEDEELKLIEKYKFNNAPIEKSTFMLDVKRAFPHAAIVGFISLILFLVIFDLADAIPLALVITLIMTIIYFITDRRQILIADLMNGGRKFRCDSVVDLAKQERHLEDVAHHVRQLIETSKHWDDKEVIPIYPMEKSAAKEAIVQSS